MATIIRLLIILFLVGTLVEFVAAEQLESNEGSKTLLRQGYGGQGGVVSKILSLFPSPTPTVTPTPTPTPTPAFNQPVRIDIPSIGMTAAVESVGLDANGIMTIPENPHVGWYSLGARPGWPGNVMIAGHYDLVSGAPAIFYNLSKIPLGADIILTDELGRTMKYQVEQSESRPIGNWSLEEIFGPTQEKKISLITCSGWWNPKVHNYSHRHIVFGLLVE